MTAKQKIQNALDEAFRCAQIDGSHHKMHCIDQMVRILTDCPMVKKTAKDCNGEDYEYDDLGESRAYKKFVKDYENGGEYEWNTGIAP